MRAVTAEDVILIHSRVIAASGGMDGLRDRAGLEAALAAPFQSFGGQELFQTDVEKIARLGYGLASNHAFLDGNKRIGMYVLLSFLETNGIKIHPSNEEVVRVGLATAAGEMKYEDILAWILENE